MTDKPSIDVPKNRELLESLLTLEGSTGETYRRFWNYSPRNIGFLAMQGCPPEPVATYRRWLELSRHVTRGQKAYAILRPIQVKFENDEGETEIIKRFKVVRALFSLSQTAGEELPPYQPPEWSEARALGSLAITRVPFQSFDGNVQGYSYERNVAVSPVAVYPFKTLMHEVAHVVSGHTTTRESRLEYIFHRGKYEFEAEGAAHIVLNEIGATDAFDPSESRGYVQHWMRDRSPTEASIRTVLNTSNTIIQAGYEPQAASGTDSTSSAK